MQNDAIHDSTLAFLTKYLSSLKAELRTVQGACITARATAGYGLPADAVTTRLLIEEPDQGWSVAVETVQRGDKLCRVRVQDYFDDNGNLGLNKVRLAYLEWLRSV